MNPKRVDVVWENTFSTGSVAGAKRSRSENDAPPAFTTAHQVLNAQSRVQQNNTTQYSHDSRRIRPSRIDLLSNSNNLASSNSQNLSEHSQRTSISSTPGPAQNPVLALSHPKYGLPTALVKNFASLGVNAIYPWQASCLLGRGHLSGEKNLVYSAPTGGGKSLVADVLMLKRILNCPDKKAILVLPYVALVQEKLKWLRRVVEGIPRCTLDDDIANSTDDSSRSSRFKAEVNSIRVTGFFGGSKARTTWSDTDIAVCTIEKANSLVNTAIEECTIDKLGVIVLDELHMLDDEHRGYLIEIMVTKLLLLQQDIQIIGMSATLSNTEVLAKWLNANYYISRYRPIPVEEFLVFEDYIYPVPTTKGLLRKMIKPNISNSKDVPASACRVIRKSEFRELAFPIPNAMVALACETAAAGYGALVFCGSRQACQTNAVLIADAMPDTLDAEIIEKRLDLVASLQSLPCGLDTYFARTIPRGVAFHHAGLTTEERVLIAEGFDAGILKVLVATCSLAAGINLPARRVILCGARMGRDLVGPAMLALLEAIATKLVSGRDAIYDYIRSSLLFHDGEGQDTLLEMVQSTLQELLDSELVKSSSDETFEPTQLGLAIVASAFSPDDGLFIYGELKRALQAFVMDGEMHIFYMFAPLQTSSEIDWMTFRDEVHGLDDSGLRTIRLVGVDPGLVNSIAMGHASIKDPALLRVYNRVYTAFQLRDLSNEIPVSSIAKKYNTARGAVQMLAQNCHGFAAGMAKFCQRMGWDMLAVVLDHMRDRLQAGARADLLEMAQVTYVKSRTARLLWENGFKSLRSLAEAAPSELVPVLMMGQPRNSSYSNNAKDMKRVTAKLTAKAEVIIASASRLWEHQSVVELDE
ncbi:DNA polymerase theta isoform 2 [Microsporum canis CBS 113480]|uniref:DNA polymerase theta isoform 2 n=1 Tax=Arthroderma otae (strain ATCC MYA-4605 / CBS 113480) TaxID=554155 RepID=C5FTJ9_ARTOC|nr:DNA polymerase theta isoform 2 [Microsporum canis CBS 113480]EEQ33202.1 DNA polymerase theta isoform 2 [Microsporum canis CBS 113480]